MTEWTREALEAEQARINVQIASGQCPWSGLTIVRCQLVDLCDCFLPRTDYVEPARTD